MTNPLRRPSWAVFLSLALIGSLLLTAEFNTAPPVAAVDAPSSPINPDTLSGYPTPTAGVDGFTQSSAGSQSWQVRDFEQVGDRVFVGGSFTEVVSSAQAGATRWSQSFIAAFDVNTGNYISSWTPELDDVVWTLQSHNGLLYVGGEFNTVNGVPREGLVALDPITGAIDPTFRASIANVETTFEGSVRDLHIEGSYLYVGGEFNRIIDEFFPHGRYNSARVNVVTGVADGSWIPRITGGSVFGIDSDPGRGRVLLGGSFEAVDALPGTDNGAVVSHTNGRVLTNGGGQVAFPMPLNAAHSRGYYTTVIDGSNYWYSGEEHITTSRNADSWAIQGCVVTGTNLGGVTGTAACTQTWRNGGGGGDYQVGELLAPNILLFGCHCRGNYYSSFENEYVNSLGYPNAGFRLFRSDGTTWDFRANMRVWGEGPYAAHADSTGCLWVGGDYGGTVQGFGRFCDMEDADGDGIDDFRDTVRTAGPSLSRGKVATQSSVYRNDAQFGPSNAVDGEALGWYLAYPLAWTENSNQPWWDVDLGASELIGGVNVYNRTDNRGDRLNNVELLISETPFGNANLATARGIADWSITIPSTSEVSQIAVPDIQGRYVRLQLPGSEHLQLAEVDVRASASIGLPPFGTPANVELSTNGVDNVTVQWDEVAGTKGYVIHRDFEFAGFVPAGSTSYVDTGLTTGETYQYEVRAQAPDDSFSPPSPVQSIRVFRDSDLPPFGIPGNPQVTTNGVDRVDLSWDGVANAKGYVVYRDDAFLQFVPFTDTAWSDTSVVQGERYEYQLAAQAPDNSYSDRTAILPITVGDDDEEPPEFGTPANARVSSNGVDTVTAEWDAVAGAKGYVIHRDFVFVKFVTGTSWDDTSVVEGETYRYQIRAQAPDNSYSDPTPILPITVGEDDGGGGELPAFGTPANVTLSTNGVDEVTITWEQVQDAKGYVIHRDFEFLKWVPLSADEWVDDTVSFGQTYRYQVRAQAFDDSYSSPSAVQSITVGTDASGPTAPTNVSVRRESNGSITVAWDASTDNIGIDAYLVYRDTTYVDFTDEDLLDFNDTGVVAGVRYRYYVRARDEAGNLSAPSETVEITP
ncbi:MAG: discoidin domain-containing protein [Actinomycetota bacterium]